MCIVSPGRRINFRRNGNGVIWLERGNLRIWLMFGAASAMGVLLHFLGDWCDLPAVYLFAPVRESVWEHLKILFYPLLLSGLAVGGKRGLAPWLFSMLAVCAAMLAGGWVYHIALRQDGFWFDLTLYFVLMLAGFLLPRVFWRAAASRGAGRLALLLTAALWVLMVIFTFRPPAGALFDDLSAVRTWFTIPV